MTPVSREFDKGGINQCSSMATTHRAPTPLQLFLWPLPLYCHAPKPLVFFRAFVWKAVYMVRERIDLAVTVMRIHV